MKFDGTDLYAALIHELKNNLGLLSMTIESIPLQGETEHDAAADAAPCLVRAFGGLDRIKTHRVLRFPYPTTLTM